MKKYFVFLIIFCLSMIVTKNNLCYSNNIGKVLSEWPFMSSNGANSVSSYVKKDSNIYFVTGKELVLMEKPNKFKLIKDIPFEVQNAVFNTKTSCFFGIGNVEQWDTGNGDEYHFSAFHVYLDGSFDKKEMSINVNNNGNIFPLIINGKEFVCLYDYTNKLECKSLDNENLEINQGDNLTISSAAASSTITQNLKLKIYRQELIDLNNGQNYGIFYSTTYYDEFPYNCDLNLNNCSRIAVNYPEHPDEDVLFYVNDKSIAILLKRNFESYIGTGTLNLVSVNASESEIEEKSNISWNMINDTSFNNILIYNGEIYVKNIKGMYQYINDNFIPVADLVFPDIDKYTSTLSNNKIYYISSSSIGYVDTTNKELEVIDLPDNASPVNITSLKNGNIVVIATKGNYNETGLCKTYTCYKYSVLFYDTTGNLLKNIDFNAKYSYFDDTTIRDLWTDYVTVTYEDDNGKWNVKIFNLNGDLISEVHNVGDYFHPQFLRKINGKLYLIGQDGDWLYIYDCENEKNVSSYSWNKGFKALESGGTVYVSALDGGLDTNYYSLYGSISLQNLLSQGKITKLRAGNFNEFGIFELFSSENGEVYIVGSDYNLDNNSGFIRAIKLGNLNSTPVIYGDSGKITIPEENYTIVRENSNVAVMFQDGRDIKTIKISDIIQPVSLSSAKDIDLKWLEKYSRIENYASPFILPLSIETNGNAYINENGSFVAQNENGNVTITITFPDYDIPYDVYIAYYNSQGLFFIGGEKGIDTNPVPIFQNLNEPFFASFDIPYKALPKGLYYLMIRKHSSNPLDFNKSGYKIWALFNIQ